MPAPFAGIRRGHRYALAAAIDSGIVATLAVGVDLVVLAALHVHIPLVPAEGISEPLTIVASVALFYAVVSRRSSAGRTAGERMLDVSYVRLGHGPDRHRSGTDSVEPREAAGPRSRLTSASRRSSSARAHRAAAHLSPPEGPQASGGDLAPVRGCGYGQLPGKDAGHVPSRDDQRQQQPRDR